MKVSFHLARQTSPRETAIIAVIRFGSERVNFSTGLSIIPKHWNKLSREARATKGISHLELNSTLSRTKNRIEEAFRRYRNDTGTIPSKTTFKEILNTEFERSSARKEAKLTFIQFFEGIILSSKEGTRLQPNGKTISPNTLKTYKTTVKHLKAFAEKRKKLFDFDTIDLDFYHDYIEFVTKQLNLSPNAIGKDIQIIKLILREAFERGITDKRAFESKRFRVMREQPDTIYLTTDELQELSQLDLKDNERQEIVRDLFLIGCYTGMRYSDYTNITKDQIDEDFTKIRYNQGKTGQLVVLPVKKEAKILLIKYFNRLREINSLPEVKYNSKTNLALKTIGKACGQLQKNYSYKKTNGGVTIHQQHAKWEKLSTHTARRTFATNELKEGTPISLIMAATGHLTEKSFWKYIRATPEEKANLLEIQWMQRESKLKVV
ncbi:site-specific integrase [Segetibacter koreensis]|uniref:site-specific integrase n=1 Tax=Segetibacter koreensis TaxID=398037 RepID=UPI000365C61E|nr:site-specific integrase [Segetibacter koreensis]